MIRRLLFAFALGAGLTFGVCHIVYSRQLARVAAERDVTPLTLTALLQPPMRKIATDLEKGEPESIERARKSCLIVVRMFIDTYDRFTAQHPKVTNQFADEYAEAKRFLQQHDSTKESR